MMIVVSLQLSEHDENRVVQIFSAGFDPELPTEAYEHKEALGRIMVSTPTWMLTVPEIIRYLITRCGTYSWRIMVMKGRREIRRFDFWVNPPPLAAQPPPDLMPKILSRYERPLVI